MAHAVLILLWIASSTCAFAANKLNRSGSVLRHPPKTVTEAKDNDSTFAKVDAWGEIGQDSLTPSDSSLTLQGLGFGGGAHYRLKAGQNSVGLLGGGIHYTSVSAASSGISITYTFMTLRPDFAFLFFPTKKFGIGGFFAMDLMMLSGSATAKYEDESASTSISSVSQTYFGPRFLYEATPSLFLGAHYGMGSGSLKVKDSTSSFKSTALTLLFVKNFK